MGTINIILLPRSPPQKLFSSMMSSTSYAHLFLSFFLFLSKSLTLSTLSPIRRKRPVCLTSWTSCPLLSLQPSGLCVLETAWRCWDTGFRKSFPRWDAECHQLPLDIDTTVGYVIFDLMNIGFVSPLANIQSSLQSETGGRGRWSWIAVCCQG